MSFTTVKFVRQSGNPHEDLMQKAFQDTQTQETNEVYRWITEEECLAVNEQEKKSVFIIANFEGPAFKNLVKTSNRIYGPLVIIACFRDEASGRLPRLHHPVHDLSMKGMTVSCTSMAKDMRGSIHERILWMCGEVSKDFHEQVTHLIAGEVGSKKYQAAVAMKTKVMLVDWVNKVWEDSQSKLCDASHNIYLKYKCPVFAGCVTTASGFAAHEREELRSIIEMHGGVYSGEMKMKECTHLIVNEPKGQKYQFALKWKIPAVSAAWVLESAESGYCRDTSAYKVTSSGSSIVGEKLTSTPSNEKLPTGRLSVMGPDVSCVSVHQINETAMDTTMGRPDPLQPDPLDELNVTTLRAGMFLDGCKIYLSGFTGERLEKIRRIINLGGGTRFSQINETISHVVMGDRVESDVQILKSGQFRPYVVGITWVLECARLGTLIPEEDFVALDVPQQEAASPVSRPPMKSSKTSNTSHSCPTAKNQAKEDSASYKGEVMGLLSQYLPDQTDESAMLKAAEMAENDNPHTVNEEEDDDATQDPSENTTLIGEGIFNGRTFHLESLALEDQEELGAAIKEAGGTVLNLKSRAVPDFAVVPLFGCELSITASEVVTIAYIHMCLDDGVLFPVTENQLFRPVALMPDRRPLEGCVLSISGYGLSHRDCLMYIAEQLGAKCQEFFVKQSRRDLEANTHLVVNAPAGNKYVAAKNWNLPAVSTRWLFECARRGVRLPEAEFSIDKVYADETIDETPALAVSAQSNPTTSKKAATPRATVSCASSENTSYTPNNTRKRVSVSKTDPAHLLENNQTPVSRRIPCVDKTNVSGSQDTPNIVATKKRVEETLMLANQRVQTLVKESKEDSPKPQSSASTVVLTPGNPDKEFRFTFAADGLDAAFPTPVGRKNRPKLEEGTPLPDMFHKYLNMAIERTGNVRIPGTPAPANNLEKSPLPTVEPLKNVVIGVSKKLSTQQSDFNNIAAELGADYRWTYDESCTHFIFEGRLNDPNKEFRQAREQGKYIVSPYWLRVEQKAHVDESIFPHNYDPNHALAVTTSKATPTRLSRRSTRSRLKTEEVASASPVVKTRARGNLAPEEDGGPSPQKRSKVLPKAEEVEQQVASDPSPSKRAFEKMDETCSDEEIAHAVQHLEDHAPATQPMNTLARVDLVNDLKNLMAATRNDVKSRRCNWKTDSTSADVSLDEPELKRHALNSSDKSDDSRSRRRSTRSSRSRTTTQEDTQSQMPEVTWDDPQTRAQQELLAAELAKNSESQSPQRDRLSSDEGIEDICFKNDIVRGLGSNSLLEDNQKDWKQSIDPDETRIPTPEPPSLAMPTAEVSRINPPINDQEKEDELDPEDRNTPKYFHFSGLTPQEKTDYGALVETLGGNVLDGSSYDRKCTHLIVDMPTRNEKYLACVATGTWVLHKSFLEACRQESAFIDESRYEWGTPATVKLLEGKKGSSTLIKLAKAACRWRQHLKGEGAFSSWKCLLVADRKKEGSFRRLLEAGGAQVMREAPNKSILDTDVNYAFIDVKCAGQVNIDSLKAAGVHCVKPDYISTYLTEDPTPQPSSCYISSVKSMQSDSIKRKSSPTYDTPNQKRLRLQ